MLHVLKRSSIQGRLVLTAWLGAAGFGDAQPIQGLVEVQIESGMRSGARVTLSRVDGGDPGVRVPGSGDGRATFTAVASGAYEVAVEGTAGVTTLPVRLEPGETLRLSAERRPGGGIRLIVRERFRTTVARFFGEGHLADLPSSRNVWSPLEVADPAAILDRMDNGGLATGEAGRFGIRGSSWTQATILVDGVDVTDPLETGTPLVHPDFEAVTGIEISSALMPAEVGAPGPALAVGLRRPGDTWRGSAQAGLTPTGLQSGNARPGLPSIARYSSWAHASATTSGPVVPDKLGLLISGTLTRLRRLERDEAHERKARLASFLARGVWRVGAQDEARALAVAQRVERPGADLGGYGGSPARSETLLLLQGAWQHRRESEATWSASGSLQRGTVDRDGPGVWARPLERLVDGPVNELLSVGRGSRAQWNLSGAAQLPPRRLLAAGHRLRLGASIAGGRSSTRPLDAPAPIAERLHGIPARVWEFRSPGADSLWRRFEAAMHAADKIEWGERLTLDTGLRLDVARGTRPDWDGAVSWLTLSPRASARLRVIDFARVTLLGGYGRYQHRLPLHYLAFGDPRAVHGFGYRWTDTNGDGLFQSNERGAVVARVGPGSSGGTLAAIDPGLKPPRTRELVAGIESRIGRDAGWMLRFVGFHRRERDLVESVNVGAPSTAYSIRYVPDRGGDIRGPDDDQLLPVHDRSTTTFGRDRYLLTNPEGHDSRYQGLELSLEKTWNGRWQMLLGATASKTEGAGGNMGFRARENDQGVIGELFDDPNADTYAAGGRLFFDRAYTIKASGSYRAPGDLRLGLAARYQDGQPFARLVVVPDLAQGPQAVRGDRNGRHRFTYTLTLDLRAEKGLTVHGRCLAAVVECFNALNTTHEVEEDVVDQPTFRRMTAVQPPRAFRVWFRVDF